MRDSGTRDKCKIQNAECRMDEKLVFMGAGNVWNGGTLGSVGSRLLTVRRQKVNLLRVIAAALSLGFYGPSTSRSDRAVRHLCGLCLVYG